MFLIAIMWAALALSFTFGKWALAYAPPMFLIGFRMMTAGAGILGYWAIWGKKRQQGASTVILRSDFFGFARVALFHVYLAFVPEFWALQHIDSLKVTLLYAVTPFLSAFLSYMLLSERLPRIKWLAMGLGFLGTIPPLFTNGGTRMEQFASLAFLSVPEFVLLLAIISGAYGWFEVKALLNRGYSIFVINGVGMLVGGVLSMTHHFLANPSSSLFPVSGTLPFLVLIIVLIVLSNVIFYNLYGYLLHRHSYTYVSFTGFLCPIFGTIFGMSLFGEKFHWLYLLGFLLTFSGLRLFYSVEKA